MKMIYRSILALGFVVSLGGAAHAQNPPQNPTQDPAPTTPPPLGPYPGRTVQGPDGILTTPEVRDEPWSFTLGVNGSYEGNALFTGFTDDEKEFSNGVQASIGRSWRLRRGDATLGATATQSFYQNTASLNDFRYSVSGGLAHMVTRRLTWTVNAGLSSGLARDSQVLTDAGAVLPSTTTAQTSAANALLSYALSSKSNVSWSVASSGVGFSAATFNDGTNVTSAGTYTRQVGRGHTLGATVDYAHTFTEDLDSNIYGFLGVWTYSASNGWMISATGGVRPYSLPTEENLKMTFAFSGGVTKPVRRNQTLGITYTKSVEQTFGLHLPANLVQTLNGTYAIALHRKVTTTFGGSLTQANDPLAGDTSYLGEVAQGSLAYRVMGNLGLSIGTSFYSRKIQTEGRVNSSTTYLALTYNTTWR